jgi:hypothetical protein
MQKTAMIFLFVFLLTGCKKNDNVGDTNYFDLTSVDGWRTISFKTNYTIQVPPGFTGGLLVGFEGNSFSVSSADNKIQLSSGYSNSLAILDFGDTLKNPIPKTIQITNNFSKLITLNQIEYFHQNTDTVGILYYLKSDTSYGRLYWKDNGELKDALEIEYNITKLDTVNKIIETIKEK